MSALRKIACLLLNPSLAVFATMSSSNTFLDRDDVAERDGKLWDDVVTRNMAICHWGITAESWKTGWFLESFLESWLKPWKLRSRNTSKMYLTWESHSASHRGGTAESGACQKSKRRVIGGGLCLKMRYDKFAIALVRKPPLMFDKVSKHLGGGPQEIEFP